MSLNTGYVLSATQGSEVIQCVPIVSTITTQIVVAGITTAVPYVGMYGQLGEAGKE